MSFAKNTSKIIGKTISKNLSGKYSQKFLIMLEKSATDALKSSSRRVISKISEATGNLIGNKMAYRITKISKNSQQNNSKLVINEHDKRKIYIARKKTIYYCWFKIKIKV